MATGAQRRAFASMKGDDGMNVVQCVTCTTHRRSDLALMLYDARVPWFIEICLSVGQSHCIEAQLLHPIDVCGKVLRHTVAA